MEFMGNLSLRLVGILATVITLAAVYFFIIKPRMGLIAARAGLEPATEEEGRAEVMKAKRAQNAF